MALTSPYEQQNYMGEYATDAAALAQIQADKWDTNGDGSGNPYPGMFYWNTADYTFKVWSNETNAWIHIWLANGSVTPTADWDFGGTYKITNLPAPTLDSDVATKGYVDSVAGGVEWQDSVLDKDLSTPPGSPTTGDRYIINDDANSPEAITAVNTGTKTFTVAADLSAEIATSDIIRVKNSTGNDAWYTVVSVTYTTSTDIVVSEVIPDATADGSIYWADTGTAWSVIGVDYIVEYNGTSWDSVQPEEGFAAYVDDENIIYVYNGTFWVKMSSIVEHNSLTGLQGGTTNEYYHMTSTEYSVFQNNTPRVYTGAGTNPNGVVTPAHIGDIYISTTAPYRRYINVDATNTGWSVI